MNGRVIRGDIGISRVYETDEGLLIEKLVPNGPADRAGLQGPKIIRRQDGFFVLQKIDRSAADVIVAVNGKKTPTAEEFLTIVERHKPGETVELTILRQGRTMQVKVQSRRWMIRETQPFDLKFVPSGRLARVAGG